MWKTKKTTIAFYDLKYVKTYPSYALVQVILVNNSLLQEGNIAH